MSNCLINTENESGREEVYSTYFSELYGMTTDSTRAETDSQILEKVLDQVVTHRGQH